MDQVPCRNLLLMTLLLILLTECYANLPPSFSMDMNNIAISESLPVGTEIYKLEGIDPEGSSLWYDLQGTDVLSVDHTTGAVTVVKPLDYEANSTLYLTISLEDKVEGAVKNNIVTEDINVIILDENDFSPEFENLSYHITVEEDTPVGTSILTNLSVIDKDTVGESLELKCLNTLDSAEACDIFEITEISSSVNSFKGAMVLNRKLNYTERSNYSFYLTATDGTLSSTADVVVNIRDVQDTPPRFLNNLTAELPEDTPLNSLVFTAAAEDGDRGNPRAIMYELIHSPMEYFQIDPVTGEVYIVRPLDREAIKDPEGILKFEVRAHEMVNGVRGNDPLTVSTAPAVVKILDVNDEPPKFDNREYFVEIPENIPEGAALPNLDMTVTDPDEGNNSAFSLELNDISGAFSIEPKSASGSTPVTIRVAHNSLDYEDPNQRKFIVLAVAKELYTKQQLSSSATITITVVDVNDNAPTFDQDNFSATVSEVASPGTPVITIVARDRDTGKFGENGLVYKLTGNGAELFEVNNRTGTVTVSQCDNVGVEPCLDFETKPEYHLQFVATDDDGKGQTSAIPLKITLTDSNDNPPVFGQSTYQIFVNEGASKFEPERFIDARDEDKTSHVSYSIVAGNDDELFKIDPETGKLKISGNKGLDVSNDTDNIINLTVLATDEKFTAITQVKITVIDVNNNAPIFQKESYLTAIPEDASLDTSVIEVQATDADTGENAEITYSLSKGANGDFKIDNMTGMVTIAAKLDYDRRNTYNIEVIAVDHGEPALTGTASLTIKVINTNDKLPYFVPATQKAEVMEDASIGTVIYNLIALDPDVNSSEALNYAATEPITALDKHGNEVFGTDIFKEFFSVDKNTGTVTVTENLQRDISAVVRIPILVTDITAPGIQQGQGLLVITIQDINDSPPNFVPPWTVDHPIYFLEIKEELPVGTIVATYKAFDEDSDIASYAISPESEHFQINQGTGIVQIKEKIDYEETEGLNFTVWAYDSGIPQLNVSALVQVKIINLNDHDPIFTENAYNISIDENSSNGTILVQVKAVDKDTGEFGEVTYELTGEHSQNFKINENTGEITIANSEFLDHEMITNCVLQVIAHDSAPVNLRRSRSVPIYITINDLNDNAPKFADESYEVSVMEDIRLNPPAPLIQLNATDLDFGINGNIHYSIISGNDNDIFLIGLDTGILYAHKSLMGLTRTFNLTVEARDVGGNGELFDRAKVTVHVVNINNHKPVFVMPYLPDSTLDILQETARKDLILLVVKATDKDQGGNGRITYHLKDNLDRIVQETDTFSIDEENGELKLIRDLTDANKTMYNVILLARDHGYPKWFQVERQLVVELINEGTKIPHFPSSKAANPYHFHVTENNKPESLIGHVEVIDKDKRDRQMPVYYYILTGNQDNDFKLDKVTGHLYTQKSFDREIKDEYKLTVIANYDPDYFVTDEVLTDLKNEGLLGESNVAHAIVTINDENDNEPYFHSSIYYAVVNAMANVNQFVTNVTAFDPDNGENGTIHYYIKASNLYHYRSDKSSGSIIPPPFNISERGEVCTATYLAENNQHRFIVDVIAREEGYPEKEAYAQIQVWIFEPEQLIRVILSRPKEEVLKEKDEVLSELSNATNYLIISDEIRYHVDTNGIKNEEWTDMYILAVDPITKSIVPVPSVLKIIDSEYDFLKDYYAGFAIENVLPAFVQARNESFDPALAALIALMILLIVGVVFFIVVCCCLRHWVLSPTDDLKKKDALIKKAIIDDINTTENPLWIEQKLKLYEEQELTMQVFNDPELIETNRRSNTDNLPEDNTYATIQHPHRRQPSNIASQGISDDLAEYATLSRIVNQQPGSNNSSLSHAPNYYEAAMGFQGSTFQVPDRLSDNGSEYGSFRGQPDKVAQTDYITELI